VIKQNALNENHHEFCAPYCFGVDSIDPNAMFTENPYFPGTAAAHLFERGRQDTLDERNEHENQNI
jgi:hypothetical protein